MRSHVSGVLPKALVSRIAISELITSIQRKAIIVSCQPRLLTMPAGPRRRRIHRAPTECRSPTALLPAQYFHLLRRQMYGGADRRGVRKPLVVFTPKNLLRHPKAVSNVAELTSGRFREVLPDTIAIDPAGRSFSTVAASLLCTTSCSVQAGRRAAQAVRIWRIISTAPPYTSPIATQTLVVVARAPLAEIEPFKKRPFQLCARTGYSDRYV
jgi:hypothetical protein